MLMKMGYKENPQVKLLLDEMLKTNPKKILDVIWNKWNNLLIPWVEALPGNEIGLKFLTALSKYRCGRESGLLDLA